MDISNKDSICDELVCDCVGIHISEANGICLIIISSSRPINRSELRLNTVENIFSILFPELSSI